MCMTVYIYIYIYIYLERVSEREIKSPASSNGNSERNAP